MLRLLHKDPDQRYPNATDLCQALRHLDRTPEPAQRPTPPAGGATQPPSTTATTPLPPAAPTRRASSLPPLPDTASTHTLFGLTVTPDGWHAWLDNPAQSI
ncbi:hypothetical protein [Kitasatospora sp. NPDC059673]|uniref:hypothetical protein n=1 Tax=Kitasatospora sp. NPDC059673 TaxID=3346901 RepID=UPI003696583F